MMVVTGFFLFGFGGCEGEGEGRREKGEEGDEGDEGDGAGEVFWGCLAVRVRVFMPNSFEIISFIKVSS